MERSYIKIITTFFILAFIFINCSDSISSKEESIHFTKTYPGIEARDILIIDDGFIVCGATSEKGDAGDNVYLMKIDKSGNFIWDKSYGTDGNDRGYRVLQTSDDKLLIGGYSYGFRYNEQQMYLLKTSLYGDIHWASAFIDTTDVQGYGDGCIYDIIESKNGDYIVIGSGVYVNGAYGRSATRTVSINKSGFMNWIKSYPYPIGIGHSIVEIDDKYMFVGNYDGLFFTDNNGEIENTISLPISKSIYFSIASTNDGNIIICGETHPAPRDFNVVKINSSGDYIWSMTSSNDYLDTAYDIQQTTDGGYIVVGTTTGREDRNYDIYLVKIKSDGAKEWEKTFDLGKDEVAFSIRQLDDNGFILVGKTYDNIYPENSEILIIRTNENGNITK